MPKVTWYKAEPKWEEKDFFREALRKFVCDTHQVELLKNIPTCTTALDAIARFQYAYYIKREVDYSTGEIRNLHMPKYRYVNNCYRIVPDNKIESFIDETTFTTPTKEEQESVVLADYIRDKLGHETLLDYVFDNQSYSVYGIEGPTAQDEIEEFCRLPLDIYLVPKYCLHFSAAYCIEAYPFGQEIKCNSQSQQTPKGNLTFSNEYGAIKIAYDNKVNEIQKKKSRAQESAKDESKKQVVGKKFDIKLKKLFDKFVPMRERICEKYSSDLLALNEALKKCGYEPFETLYK